MSTANKALTDHLKYAVLYSSEDGARGYLNSAKKRMSEDEIITVNKILASKKGALNETIQIYLNSLSV